MRIALAILLIPFSAPAQDATASVTGELQDPAGAVVTGAPLTLQSEATPERIFRSQSNAAGKYRFADVPPDRYVLIVQQNGFKWFVSSSIAMSAGEQREMQPIRLEVLQGPFRAKDAPLEAFGVQLLFPRGERGNLTGTVVDPKALRLVGAPVAGAQVTLLCDGLRVCGFTRTGVDGIFRFTELTPGTYGLKIQGDGYYPETSRRVEVHPGLELIYRVYIEACQTDDCDLKRRVEPVGVYL